MEIREWHIERIIIPDNWLHCGCNFWRYSFLMMSCRISPMINWVIRDHSKWSTNSGNSKQRLICNYLAFIKVGFDNNLDCTPAPNLKSSDNAQFILGRLRKFRLAPPYDHKKDLFKKDLFLKKIFFRRMTLWIRRFEKIFSEKIFYLPPIEMDLFKRSFSRWLYIFAKRSFIAKIFSETIILPKLILRLKRSFY